MTRRTSYLISVTLSGLLACLLSCTTVGNSGPGPVASVAPSGGTAPLPAIAGNWTGTWNDTRYSKSGGLAATFKVTGGDVTATGSIDLTQLGLGKESGTASGSISGNTLTLNFKADTVGSGSVTLNGSNGNGSGTVTGALNFGAFTFTGTATNSTITGTFKFTSATGGNGTVSMTKM